MARKCDICGRQLLQTEKDAAGCCVGREDIDRRLTFDGLGVLNEGAAEDEDAFLGPELCHSCCALAWDWLKDLWKSWIVQAVKKEREKQKTLIES